MKLILRVITHTEELTASAGSENAEHLSGLWILGVISRSGIAVSEAAQLREDSMNCAGSALHHSHKCRQENWDLHGCADALGEWGTPLRCPSHSRWFVKSASWSGSFAKACKDLLPNALVTEWRCIPTPKASKKISCDSNSSWNSRSFSDIKEIFGFS